MLVQCPKCKTTYKVSDEVIKGASPAFRCSRCKHIFELQTTPTVEPLGSMPPAESNELIKPDEREPSFVFGAPSGTEENESQDHKKPVHQSALFAAKAATDDETAESWSLRGAEEMDEKSFTMTGPQPADEKIFVEPVVAQPSFGGDPRSRETAENIVPINEFRDHAASTVPFLTLFGLLVIFFFLTTAYLEAHPKTSETVFRKIPFLGPSVVRNSYLKNGVLLKSLRAGYQSIQGNREVLVVSGEAVNQNPVVIREVRVLGQLYNSEGRAVEQQAIWLGNALSPQIVRGMSAQDIIDLQRLKPLKSFEVPSGDSISFAIVFLRPRKEIKNFSCAVASAEGET